MAMLDIIKDKKNIFYFRIIIVSILYIYFGVLGWVGFGITMVCADVWMSYTLNSTKAVKVAWRNDFISSFWWDQLF